MARVLVVEDNAANQRLMRMILKSMGHGVVCASTGEEGLRRSTEGSYDLVIMDMHLPKMDGFELCKKLKASHGCDLKVLAVTALVMDGDRRMVMASGCDGYMSKPISVSAFRKKVRRFLLGEGQ